MEKKRRKHDWSEGESGLQHSLNNVSAIRSGSSDYVMTIWGCPEFKWISPYQLINRWIQDTLGKECDLGPGRSLQGDNPYKKLSYECFQLTAPLEAEEVSFYSWRETIQDGGKCIYTKAGLVVYKSKTELESKTA